MDALGIKSHLLKERKLKDQGGRERERERERGSEVSGKFAIDRPNCMVPWSV